MRVVFDTNVLVPILTLPGGGGDEALRKIIQGEDSLALSRPIVAELLSVPARKFAHDRGALARVAVFFAELGDLLDPAQSLKILSDEPDDRILECALAADARVTVTGDRAMLAIQEFQGIRIIYVVEYRS